MCLWYKFENPRRLSSRVITFQDFSENFWPGCWNNWDSKYHINKLGRPCCAPACCGDENTPSAFYRWGVTMVADLKNLCSLMIYSTCWRQQQRNNSLVYPPPTKKQSISHMSFKSQVKKTTPGLHRFDHLPSPELRRTPPRNSLLCKDSLSHTVSSRHISFSFSRVSSLYTNVSL